MHAAPSQHALLWLTGGKPRYTSAHAALPQSLTCHVQPQHITSATTEKVEGVIDHIVCPTCQARSHRVA